MNTTDLLTRWSTLSLEEIEAELDSSTAANAAEGLFGAEEVEEMRTVARTRAPRGPRQAVVYLPGLMGSLLISVRGVTSLLWINPVIYLKGQANLLELAPDGQTDAHPQVEAVPFALEKIYYLKLALALHRQAILFEFPYDWRRPIESNGDLLHRSIERWAAGNPDMQFTLVGHSMGGLVSRAYMALHPQAAERRIKRLIMLGTPNFGAAGAVGDIGLGNRLMALAAKLHENNVMRRVVTNMPSGYQLLPAPRELFPAGRPYPVNFDVYDASAWPTADIRQDYLDAGRRFHELLAGADPQVETVEIAGCHVETTTDVQRQVEAGGSSRLEVIRRNDGAESGDGTVPLWSAWLPGATVYYIQAVHRSMARNKQVVEATLDLVDAGVCELPTELPPPKAGFFDRFRAAGPIDAEADKLRAVLEDGTATEEDLAQLFFLGG